MSNVVLFLRVGVSLAVVLGLLGFFARAAAKRGMGTTPGKRSTAKVEIISRQGLGRNTSVVVVRAAERALVLGVTDTSVTLLLETDVDVLDITEPEAQGTVPSGGPLPARSPAWKDTLEHLRERTVRRS